VTICHLCQVICSLNYACLLAYFWLARSPETISGDNWSRFYTAECTSRHPNNSEGKTTTHETFKTVQGITQNLTSVHMLHCKIIPVLNLITKKHTWCNMLLHSGIVQLVIFVSDYHCTTTINLLNIRRHNTFTTTES